MGVLIRGLTVRYWELTKHGYSWFIWETQVLLYSKSGIAAVCLPGEVIIKRKLEEVEIVYPEKPNGQQQIII